MCTIRPPVPPDYPAMASISLRRHTPPSSAPCGHSSESIARWYAPSDSHGNRARDESTRRTPWRRIRPEYRDSSKLPASTAPPVNKLRPYRRQSTRSSYGTVLGVKRGATKWSESDPPCRRRSSHKFSNAASEIHLVFDTFNWRPRIVPREPVRSAFFQTPK